VTVLWSKAAGPGTVNFADSGAAETTAGFSEDGMYELRLEATDGVLRSVDYVRVQVGAWTVPAAPGALKFAIRDGGGPLIQAADLSLDEDGFRLERRLSSGGSWERVMDLPRNEPGGVDQGLTPGQYEYRLQAWNRAGGSAWSTAILLYDVPPAVDDLTAARQADPTEVLLSWANDPAAKIDEHWIYARDAGEANWTLLAKRGGQNTAYTDTRATGGVARSYRILSRNALGEGPEATAAVSGDGGGEPDETPPTVPQGLGAGGVTETGFVLSWDASTDNVGVNGYEVRLDGVSQGTTAGLNWNFSGLTAETDYDLEVRALDAAGNASGWSTVLTVTTEADGSGNVGTSAYLQNFSTATPGTSVGLTGTDWRFYRVDTGAEVTGTTGTKAVRIRGEEVFGDIGASEAAGVGSLPDPDLPVGSAGYAILQFNNGGGYLAVSSTGLSLPAEVRVRLANDTATASVRLALRVGGQWVVSESEHSRSSAQGFADVVFSAAEDGDWRELDGTPGEAALGVGSALTSSLSGGVEAFGFWVSFTGGNVVYVDRVSVEGAASAEGYAAWAADIVWPAAGVDGPGDDADGDGVLNRFEYAFGSDPADDGSRAFPMLQAAGGGGLTLRFRARVDAPDLQYTPMYSGDLEQWNPAAGTVSVVDADVDGDGVMELREATIPMPSGWTELFGAVSVEDPP
jgi:chitodextrinase